MITFFIPILLANMLQAVYVLIDAMWAGRLLGTVGVAIVATGMPIMFFLSSLIAGLTMGASILAGQAYGAKNRALLSDIISSSVIGVLALTLVIAVLGIAFCAPLLHLINTPAPLFHGTRLFLSIIIGGMFVNALVQWFFAIMNATGDSKTPFRILIVTVVLNAVLAPVLITGAGILPPLGVAGSALSTICAHIAGAVYCFFSWRNHHLSEIAPFRFRVHWGTLKKTISIGFPMALQMLIVSSSFLFILSLANKFGPSVTAAFGIGSRVDQIAFLAIFAVTAAVSAMTAQNIGAGKIERIPEIVRWGVLLSLALSCFFAAAVVLFPDQITSLFTSDPSVIAVSRGYYRAVAASYIALAFTFAYQGVLRGAGDTFASFIMIASSMIFLRVPLCYYLSHCTRLKETGLWAGITVSASIGAIAFYLYYVSGWWKERGARVQPPATDASVLPPEIFQPE
jgi:putative MATE family efflux protein